MSRASALTPQGDPEARLGHICADQVIFGQRTVRSGWGPGAWGGGQITDQGGTGEHGASQWAL
jgi:hypothetical protein